MIHYHGTPFGSTRQDTARFLAGRHALVPYPRQDDMGIVAAVCQDFAFDNGAFTIWKQGGALDTRGYLEWVKAWCQHPGFEWALIPDIIEGSEEENDALVEEFQAEGGAWYGVPVWHLHESIGRLERLCCDWPGSPSAVQGNGQRQEQNPGGTGYRQPWMPSPTSRGDPLPSYTGYG